MKKLIKRVKKELNHPEKLLKYKDLYLPMRDENKSDESKHKNPTEKV